LLNVYTDINHYKNCYRNHLVDLLRPIIPENKLSQYGIREQIIKLEDNIENCDICLLPMSWNYYLENGLINVANTFIQKAHLNNKKIIIWTKGDFYYSIPKNQDIIEMQYSTYKSKSNSITFSLPVIINDPLVALDKKSILVKSYYTKPLIGFCGQVDSRMLVSIIKLIILIWEKFAYYFNLSNYYAGPIIPPTYIRKKILNILERSNLLKTNIIRRDNYKGGKLKGDVSFDKLNFEFYNNIIETDYTVCIRGRGNFSARLYETLALGRIPVLFNTDSMLPFSKEINWEDHLIFIDKYKSNKFVDEILEFHNSLSKEEFRKIQINNRKLWEEYFYFPNYYKKIINHLKEYVNE
tara:strand:+ start:23718 stop:24776 length:1059 start_codon:yes stop_codon:yes gene_type:complete